MVAIKPATIAAVPDTAATVLIQAIRRARAQAAAIQAIPAPSAAAPMRAMRAFASNAALPCRPANVPVAAQNWWQAPGFAANAVNPSSRLSAYLCFNFIFTGATR